VDTFWQTETGGHMMTPLPGATPLVPGSCTLPLPGIMAAIVDETGNDLPNGQGGILVVKRPWPSMIRTIWGDPERFKKSYFPEEFGGKLYLAGDGAIRNKDTAYFTITGRIDDVLNVSGHRMGTMEIESALVANPLVAEAAVVGKPDDTTGEAICAFVVLKGARPTGDEAKKIATELRNWVAKEIGPIANRKKSVLATTCRKPVPAKLCAVCCVCWRRVKRLRRMCPHWKILPFWNNSNRHNKPVCQFLCKCITSDLAPATAGAFFICKSAVITSHHHDPLK
jgi:acetyl-CoA synthetase